MRYSLLFTLLLAQLSFAEPGMRFNDGYRWTATSAPTGTPLTISNVNFVGTNEPDVGSEFTATVYQHNEDGFGVFITGVMKLVSATTLEFTDVHTTSYCRNPWKCDLQLDENSPAPNLMVGDIRIISSIGYKAGTAKKDQPCWLLVLWGQSNAVCWNYNVADANKMVPDTENVSYYRRYGSIANGGQNNWQPHSAGYGVLPEWYKSGHVAAQGQEYDNYVIKIAGNPNPLGSISPGAAAAIKISEEQNMCIKILPAAQGGSAFYYPGSEGGWWADNRVAAYGDDFGPIFSTMVNDVQSILAGDSNIMLGGFITELGASDAGQSETENMFSIRANHFINRVRNANGFDGTSRGGSNISYGGAGNEYPYYGTNGDYLFEPNSDASQTPSDLANVPLVWMEHLAIDIATTQVTNATINLESNNYFFEFVPKAPLMAMWDSVHWTNKSCTKMGQERVADAWLNSFKDRPDPPNSFNFPNETTAAGGNYEETVAITRPASTKVGPLMVSVEGETVEFKTSNTRSNWGTRNQALYDGESVTVRMARPNPGETRYGRVTVGDSQDVFYSANP